MTPDRLFAALLRLYPKRFRQEYGDDMLGTFRELRVAPGEQRCRLWRFIVADTLRAAAALWWEECCRTLAVRWLATCAAGLVSTAAVANVAAWVFSYLYHPYLEGLTFSPFAYGAFFGIVLGGTVAVSQWWLLPRPDTRAWAFASAVTLLLAALLCGTVVNRTVMGMNPIAEEPIYAALRSWTGAFDQPDAFRLTIEFTAMASSAVICGALTRRRFERRHAC